MLFKLRYMKLSKINFRETISQKIASIPSAKEWIFSKFSKRGGQKFCNNTKVCMRLILWRLQKSLSAGNPRKIGGRIPVCTTNMLAYRFKNSKKSGFIGGWRERECLFRERRILYEVLARAHDNSIPIQFPPSRLNIRENITK